MTVRYARAVARLAALQRPSGAVAGEVGWNIMLVAQYVILCRVVGHAIPTDRAARIERAIERAARPDGGWGMHPQSQSYLFHTLLAYVALRLLGRAPDDPRVVAARRWILGHGGVTRVPTWGRVWLALLGLYPWDHVQPIAPELWLQPAASPAHPRRFYCHLRLIYLGLSYVYGSRLTADPCARLDAIKRELYPGGYDAAPFAAHRHEVASTDLYEPTGVTLRALLDGVRRVEGRVPAALRRRALARAMDHIRFEFESTDYVCLSPVNGMLFCLALFAEDPYHPDLPRALAGIEYWVWEDDDAGMRIAGARSDIWDTSFAVQALCEGPRVDHTAQLVTRMCDWLARAQLRADIPGGAEHYRAPARGGWGFADERHPWPVSDCTAEAIEALLAADRLRLGPDIAPDLAAAVGFILARQNDDGGFGSYEARRGSPLLRRFNPAEIYGSCMIEESYTECTASCVRGLVAARAELGPSAPRRLRRAIDRAVRRGARRLLAAQERSGAWAGFWGIHYTYGTFFAVSALRAAGLPAAHAALLRARDWLLEHQRVDGGWGESHEGLLHGRPAPLPPGDPSLVVQTAWAALTLLELRAGANARVDQAIERAIGLLAARQRADGSWPREPATGVFFNTAVLDYDLYRQVFPTWALARFSARVTRSPG
ncbi:MAG: hypothetical protein KC468_30590 [Myxococcales bacterium]|nr:hypothetical protein [Myxococcales bacterium]